MTKMKRCMAFILMLVMLLGTVPGAVSTRASAESGVSLVHNLEDGLTFGGHTTSPLTNRFTGESGMSISGLNNHKLGYYDAFCTDPLLTNGSGYILAGNASNAITDYWGAFSEADRRYIAALIQFYANYPYHYDCNPNHGKSANWVAKMGTQLALFQYVLSDDTRGYISEVMDDGTWYDIKDYCAYAEQWAFEQQYNVPFVFIAQPSFDNQRIKLEYDVITGMYTGSITDENGALVSEGYDFTGIYNGVSVTQSGNTVYLSASAADAVAAGLHNYENAWCATATVTKSVTDTVNMNAVKLYASPQNHNSTQQLVIYDPEEQPSTVTDSATATIYAYVEMVGYAQLEKTSADTGLTADNPCYSLENAAYGVFSSVEEANWGAYPIATMVTDTAGVSNVVALPVGDYYVKEINARAGYALDPNVYPITVQQGSTAVLQCSDIPTSDPVLIVLKKVDAAIFDEGRTSGGMSLEGAEYKVDYYPDQFASAEAAFATGLPGRSWTLRTDSQGYAFFDTEHFVEGDPYYYVDEQIVFPLGTIIVYETKAPVGYKLDEARYVVNITEDGQDASYVHTYNKPITPETAIMGGVCVTKRDADSPEDIAMDVSLAGCEFTIFNANQKSVVVNGVEIEPGGAALVITTDELGFASSGDHILPYGYYQIRETTAPRGYQINTDWVQDFSISEDGVILDMGICPDKAVQGGLAVQKVDAVLGTSTPYGDASFAGCVFEISNASDRTIIVNGASYRPGEAVLRITTDSTGLARTPESCLPCGRYTVREVAVPENGGYSINAQYESTVEIISEETLTLAEPCANIGNVLGGLTVQKVDEDSGAALPEGNGSLAGAVFSVVNASTNPVSVNGITIPVGDVVTKITTDESGIASTGNILPMGTYTVREASASEGYLTNEIWVGTAWIRENGQTFRMEDDLACPETVIKGGVSVQKLDLNTGTNRGPGGVFLNNAEITIINRSERDIVFNGKSIPPYVGDFDPSNREAEGIVTRIYTDVEGIASTGEYALPYGDYQLFETAAPSGYFINREWSKTISIRENGRVYVLDGENSVKDEIARTDIRFNKEGVRGNNHVFLANVVFRMTNLETGESHILVTDPNGSFDSANQQHSYCTNGNDAAVNEAGEVDESLISYEYGVWFGGGYPVDSVVTGGHVGAFVIGSYLLEELPCTANADYVLCEPFEILLYKRENQESYFVGTITNNAPTLGTTLLDKNTKAHLAQATENTVLVDTVTYSGLKTSNQMNYELRGFLVDKDTSEPLLVNGKTVEAIKSFQASDTAGTVDVEFSFDASALAGHSVVAYEYLYMNDVLVSQHDSIDDEKQTVSFPKIRTSAANEEGKREVYISGDMTIVDTVCYENLIPGYNYTLQGTLMDSVSGKPVLDSDGKEITATVSFFVKDSPTGTAEVIFRFDGSELKAMDTVVFEKLFVFEDVFLSAHEDLSDPDQTITILGPEIGTTLTAANGKHIVCSGEETILTDQVSYSNLQPGTEYTLEAMLVQPDSISLKDKNGNPITAKKTFVPDTPSGVEDVVFHFDSTNLAGTTVVAFEELLCSGRVIAAHENPTDESQSVHFPSVRTMAAGREGEKTLMVAPGSDTIELVDTVIYANLIPGERYKVSGTLHDKADNSIIKSSLSKEPYISEVEFTPDSDTGTVEVVFTVALEDIQGKHVVVFESLMHEADVLAKHEDLDDADQTVFAPNQCKVFKYDASSNEGLSGAVFEVRDITTGSEAIPVQTATTDEDGYFFFSGIPEHEYGIKEIRAPEEYNLSEVEYRVRVGRDGTLEGDTKIPNIHGGTVIITKVDVVTGDPLADCEITVYDADHNSVFRQMTDLNGKIYFYTTKAGTYSFKETKSCDGYYLNDDEYYFVIDSEMTVTGTVRFGNVPFGTAVIKKADKSGAPLNGAQIAVFSEDGSKFLGQSTTGDNGRVYFVSPGPGRYYFVEVKAPDGYIKSDTKYYFEIASDYTISGNMTLVNQRNPSPSSSTGDSSNIWFWLISTVVSFGGMAIALILVLRKRRNVKDT